MLRRLGKWRVRVLSVIAVIVLLLSAMFAGLLPTGQSEQIAGVRLAPEKKLFQVGEQPVLALHFYHNKDDIGFWRGVFGVGLRSVYAASAPTVEVDYNGKKAVDVSSSVQPHGRDFLITLHSKDQLKPGTYTVKATGTTTSGQKYNKSTNFAWGVLAINTTKSIYMPGETAQIHMAVLDSGGHTVCAAPLRLTVMDPNGSISDVEYQRSDGCHGDSLNSEPDYSADFKTRVVGRYKMTLGIKDTPYSVIDYFEVRPHVPFDVTRKTATRLYPVQGYSVSMHVEANQGFNGTVTEILSDARFKILDAGGATVRKHGGKVVLTWKKQFRPGRQYDLSYKYFAPPVSPAFFTLGPLTFTDAKNTKVFQEARAWQLADDAAITFVKETSATTSSSGATSLTGSVTSTAGNTIILFVFYNQTGVSIDSIVDNTRGSNPTQCVGDANNTGVGNQWQCPQGIAADNPPINYSSSSATHHGIAYTTNASALTSITVDFSASAAAGFNAVEFSNIDATNPVESSASGYWGGSSHDNVGGTQMGANTATPTTPIIAATTCDSPTTDQLLRGGDYFCTSSNELIIGGIMTGGGNVQTVTTAGFTALTRVVIPIGTASCVGAYNITSASGSYSIGWSLSSSNKSSESIMAFRQAGNTSGGDEQSFFWAK